MIRTSTAEEDYSDYMQHLSNMGNMYTFLSGFVFTAITVLLNQLPERTIVMAQIALLFMASLLDVFILYMGDSYMKVVYLCKRVPPYSGKPSPANILSDLSVLLGLGGTTILLFLTFGLVHSHWRNLSYGR